jgi:multidrug efflux pump subunit AcrB
MIRGIVRMAVGNPVAANLAMGAILVCGWFVYGQMPREVFPDYSLGKIEILTPYPGASAEDVERLITRPLEDAVDGVRGLDEILSVSQEGISRLTLTLARGEDPGEILEDVRDAVRRKTSELPEQAKDPRVQKVESVFPVIAVFVYGTASEGELRRLAEKHRRGLEAIPGVRTVVLTGTRKPRVWIEVDPTALERYSLTLEQVGAAVGAKAASVPLGSLETSAGDWSLRVDAQLDWARDLENLPILTRPDGSLVRLSQVAFCHDTFERGLTRARFNGRPCLHMQVNKTSSGDIIDIARAVYDYVERESLLMPAGTSLGTNSDLSVYVSNRLQIMKESGALGGLLVLGALFLFLSFPVALVTALGVPIAFMGGLLLAGALGVSMNMITMFALIVVLGMVVDDAIVVGENVYRLMEEGMDPHEAAITGTAQVGRPVVATILTSIAAFLPILMLGGQVGNFLRPLPLVVSLCLVVSIFEALTILPVHLAHWAAPRMDRGKARGGRTWYLPLRALYTRFLSSCLRWRYVTLAAALSILAVVGTLGAYRVPFVFFDDFESKLFYVSLRLEPGTSLDETERVARVVEAAALALPESELESVNTLLGVSAPEISIYELGSNLAQLWIELREGPSRQMSVSEVIELLRADLDPLPPGVQGIEFGQMQAGPSGRAIELGVRGDDLQQLEEISRRLQEELLTFAGVRDVHDNLDAGARQVRVRLGERGRSLGFTEAGLASELRSAFEGTTFGHLRRGTDDVELVVKYPEWVRQQAGVLERLRVAVPGTQGQRVPLFVAADLVYDRGPATITRDGLQRSVTVTADVNKSEGNAADITAVMVERWQSMASEYPGYSLDIKGDAEETSEALAGLTLASGIALVLIYLILGTLFRSFFQPLVIMFIIPFASLGMVVGHGIMGVSITLLSLIGLLALIGVVVNDSLILVDFANWRRAQGDGLVPALLEAGRLRFRPILLTSVTTMLGLSPLTFFVSGDARFLQPMAISIFYGLGAATLLVLVLVPCCYAVLADFLSLFSKALPGSRRREALSVEVSA